jgi:hypothetical protein
MLLGVMMTIRELQQQQMWQARVVSGLMGLLSQLTVVG